MKDLVTHKEKSEFENTTSDLPELKLESQPPIQLEAESSENPLVVPAGLSSPFLCRTEPTDELPIPTGRSYNWKVFCFTNFDRLWPKLVLSCIILLCRENWIA